MKGGKGKKEIDLEIIIIWQSSKHIFKEFADLSLNEFKCIVIFKTMFLLTKV